MVELAERFYEEFLDVQELVSGLPERAKEIFLWYLLDSCSATENRELAVEILAMSLECDSPIEKIFSTAFVIVGRKYCDFWKQIKITPQKEIETQNAKYRADFFIECLKSENPFDDSIYNLIVECDGHDFHKLTKKQVERDNERDYDLKKSGYDIIHFSGSQIYKNPWKCADEILIYLESKI